MTAPSPGIVATTLMNAHYDSHEAYVNALAVQLRKEYLAIHEAGLILQVDAPDLAMERVMTFQDETDEQFVKIAEMHLAAINKACEGIPADRWRLHICWGNWEGPHVYDIALRKCCRCSTRRPRARCRSSSPIRATSTNTRRSRRIRFRRTRS